MGGGEQCCAVIAIVVDVTVVAVAEEELCPSCLVRLVLSCSDFLLSLAPSRSWNPNLGPGPRPRHATPLFALFSVFSFQFSAPNSDGLRRTHGRLENGKWKMENEK